MWFDYLVFICLCKSRIKPIYTAGSQLRTKLQGLSRQPLNSALSFQALSFNLQHIKQPQRLFGITLFHWEKAKVLTKFESHSFPPTKFCLFSCFPHILRCPCNSEADPNCWPVHLSGERGSSPRRPFPLHHQHHSLPPWPAWSLFLCITLSPKHLTQLIHNLFTVLSPLMKM